MCGVIKQPTADLNLKTEHSGTIELNEEGTATVFIFNNFPDMIYLNKTYHNIDHSASPLSPSPRETINSHYYIPTFQVIYQVIEFIHIILAIYLAFKFYMQLVSLIRGD